MMGSPLLVTMGMVVDEEVDKEVYTMMGSRCSCSFCKRSFPANWRRPACNNDVAVLAPKKTTLHFVKWDTQDITKIDKKKNKLNLKSKEEQTQNYHLALAANLPKLSKTVTQPTYR